MYNVNEPHVQIGNYLSFGDVPGLDISALALARVISCFVSTVLAMPLTGRRWRDLIVGGLWAFCVAGVFEALADVLAYSYYMLTAPPSLPYYAFWLAPQAAAYYVTVDGGAILAAVLMCAALGHLPAYRLGMPRMKSTGAIAQRRIEEHRAMLGGLDKFLFMFLAPAVYTALDIAAAILLVKYASKPARPFRAPAFIVAIISFIMTIVVWTLVRVFAAAYVGLINLAVASDAGAVSKRASHVAAVGVAETRINIVWGTVAGTVAGFLPP